MEDVGIVSYQVLVNIGFGLTGALILLLIRHMLNMIRDNNKWIKETQKELSKMKEVMSKEYVSKPEFRYMVDILLDTLKRIEKKVDK